MKDTTPATKPDFVHTVETIDTLVSDWVTAKVMSEPATSGVKNMSAVSIFFAAGQGHARHNHCYIVIRHQRCVKVFPHHSFIGPL